MKKMYIREAAVEITKELDNEQRKENSLSGARKRTNNDASNRRRNQTADENRAGVSGYGYNWAPEEVGGIPEEGITHYSLLTKPALRGFEEEIERIREEGMSD